MNEVDFVPEKGVLHIKHLHPRKIILFWEVTSLPNRVIQLYFKKNFDDLTHIVRLYDVTDILFNGKNAHYFHEITVPYQNGYWIIKGLLANRSFVAELGVNLSDHVFFPILRSNAFQTANMEIPSENEFYHEIVQFQQHEEKEQKWTDYVSTYSFYEKERTVEG